MEEKIKYNMTMKEKIKYMEKIKKSKTKDFKDLKEELDTMLENKIIDENDYAYLFCYLLGVIDTKIDYNIK